MELKSSVFRKSKSTFHYANSRKPNPSGSSSIVQRRRRPVNGSSTVKWDTHSWEIGNHGPRMDLLLWVWHCNGRILTFVALRTSHVFICFGRSLMRVSNRTCFIQSGMLIALRCIFPFPGFYSIQSIHGFIWIRIEI